MKIEFALLHKNGTWGTLIVDVPFDEDAQLTDIEEWAQTQMLSEGSDRPFGKAHRVYIYDDEPEENSG